MKKNAEIKSSKNYDWFKFLSNNRPISPRHIKELEAEFDKYGNITEVSPITVNANGFIYDGQHRIIICKKRDLPVHYVESDAPKELTPAMNSKQKAWNALNYIEFFAAYKPEYEALRRFMQINEITFPVASAVIFSGLNRKYASDRKLKDGTLEVRPFLEGAQKNMDIVSEIGEKMGSSMNERYVRGIVKCLENEEFDLERFNKKLNTVMKMAPALPNPRLRAIEDVMRNLEAIYNFMQGDNTRVMLFR